MLDVVRGATLVAATVAVGLVAGLFWSFSVAVMPGLRRADARTFVATMQRINVAIVNPLFLVSFLGAPVLTIAAGALGLGTDEWAAFPWILAGLALYGVAFVITIGLNIPLNNALEAAGPPDGIADLAAVRASFEAPWVRWNIVRALASTAALACLSWALVLYGRTT